MSIGMQCHI